MNRVGRDVSIFFGADGMPFAEGDGTPIAAAGGSGRTAFLLATVNPVGKLVVGDDVIKLRGGLVVPGTPSGAGVDADGGALIAGQQNNLRIFGIEPDGMIVVTAGRAFDGGEVGAGVGGAIGGRVANIDDVLVVGSDADPGEIETTAPDAVFVVDFAPGFAGVV